ncbi:MauE/DoxX family redox-associated membrane protein [Nocardia colli]|uniref:MauE/DoxX family redox-associated membrane protein n=1 Tax=Nocardia colli TaxID=2545717 RepID=UPI00295E4477|nr:MauE/DoxX family redox-associated membrane protein [Nocardia colli]
MVLDSTTERPVIVCSFTLPCNSFRLSLCVFLRVAGDPVWIGVELLVRTIVGGLFIAAGFAKLSATAQWRQEWVASYELIPGPLVRPVAAAVPLVEMVTGIWLLLGAFGPTSVWVAVVVLVAVTVAVISALMRRLGVPCGCFGTLGELISWRIVVRNLVFIAALIGLALHGLTATITILVAPVQVSVMAMLVVTVAMVARRQSRPAQYTELVPAAIIPFDRRRVERPPL